MNAHELTSASLSRAVAWFGVVAGAFVTGALVGVWIGGAM